MYYYYRSPSGSPVVCGPASIPSISPFTPIAQSVGLTRCLRARAYTVN